MRISLVAALSTNNVIGRDNRLPWHQSTDLKRFKNITMGHHIIMGRKTWDEIGAPLPGRPHIVITRDANLRCEGATVVLSIEEALRIAREAGEDEACIIGGGKIFELSLHIADRMYLTRIHAEIEGDAFFPEFDDVREWRLIDSEHFEADDKNDYPFTFLTYERAAQEGHAIPSDE